MNRKDDALAAYSHASQIAEQTLGRNHRAALELLVAKADSFAYFAVHAGVPGGGRGSVPARDALHAAICGRTRC